MIRQVVDTGLTIVGVGLAIVCSVRIFEEAGRHVLAIAFSTDANG